MVKNLGGTITMGGVSSDNVHGQPEMTGGRSGEQAPDDENVDMPNYEYQEPVGDNLYKPGADKVDKPPERVWNDDPEGSVGAVDTVDTDNADNPLVEASTVDNPILEVSNELPDKLLERNSGDSEGISSSDDDGSDGGEVFSSDGLPSVADDYASAVDNDGKSFGSVSESSKQGRVDLSDSGAGVSISEKTLSKNPLNEDGLTQSAKDIFAKSRTKHISSPPSDSDVNNSPGNAMPKATDNKKFGELGMPSVEKSSGGISESLDNEESVKTMKRLLVDLVKAYKEISSQESAINEVGHEFDGKLAVLGLPTDRISTVKKEYVGDYVLAKTEAEETVANLMSDVEKLLLEKPLLVNVIKNDSKAMKIDSVKELVTEFVDKGQISSSSQEAGVNLIDKNQVEITLAKGANLAEAIESALKALGVSVDELDMTALKIFGDFKKMFESRSGWAKSLRSLKPGDKLIVKLESDGMVLDIPSFWNSADKKSAIENTSVADDRSYEKAA